MHLTVLRGNAAEPHDVDLALEELGAAKPVGRMARPGTGLLRITEFAKTTPDQIKSEVSNLTRSGASRLVIDLRGTAFGDLDAGDRSRAALRGERRAHLSTGSRQGAGVGHGGQG